jgi:hypothetical protein
MVAPGGAVGEAFELEVMISTGRAHALLHYGFDRCYQWLALVKNQ